MILEKEHITVYWLKKDLRLVDNAALVDALSASFKVLVIYPFEPSLKASDHYSERHWNFIKECIVDLNEKLAAYDTKVLCIEDEVIHSFETILQTFHIKRLVSTEEIGVDITYTRDRKVKQFCFAHQISWKEHPYNGVQRGRKDRTGWSQAWYDYMTQPIESTELSKDAFISRATIDQLQEKFKLVHLSTSGSQFQKGGRTQAEQWRASFFGQRLQHYSTGISKPLLSRMTCSRLSPYIAWGNLSIRELYKEAIQLKKEVTFKRAINAFTARLRWQSHFIQKFEMEPRMEFEAVNRGYLSLDQPINNEMVTAWKNGKTGYPLVDAAIRCVAQTGYLNFRMRTMITSFFCHHLFQHFSHMSAWLARQFLDFEPGIHYGQLQMQAGFTGTNTIRIYNPTKNAHDHDPQAQFIKMWVPELAELPIPLAIEPWNITPMESKMYDFEYGKNYPHRIVDTSETRKIALEKLYGARKSELFKKEKQRILDRHTIKRDAK